MKPVKSPPSSSGGDAGTDEAVSIRYVALDSVARWPRNPKLHDFDTLTESLQRFGFTAPLVYDERSERLVAGHGRLEALLRMRAAGAPRPRRIGVDPDTGAWTVPVLTGISFGSEQEAEAYLLADNRISELGGWNAAELDTLIRDLDDLTGVGFEILEKEAAAGFGQSGFADELLWGDPDEDTAPLPPKPAPEIPVAAKSTRHGFVIGDPTATRPPPPQHHTPAGSSALQTVSTGPKLPWTAVTTRDATDESDPDDGDDSGVGPIESDPRRDLPAVMAAIPKPTVIVQYNIIFDDTDQRDRFIGLLRDLKVMYPDRDTVAARLDSYLRDTAASRVRVGNV